MGAGREAKGRADRQPTGQAPAGVSLPPTNLQCRAGTAAGVPGAKPPAKLTYGLPLPAGKGAGGMGAGREAKGRADRQPTGQAPAGVSLPPTNLQCRAGTATGVPGAKPPAELTYSLPLPRRGRGLGGMGAEKQANGKVDRQPPGQTHRRGIASSCIQCRPGKPLSNTTSPPTSSAASHPTPGMQGAKPLA